MLHYNYCIIFQAIKFCTCISIAGAIVIEVCLGKYSPCVMARCTVSFIFVVHVIFIGNPIRYATQPAESRISKITRH